MMVLQANQKLASDWNVFVQVTTRSKSQVMVVEVDYTCTCIGDCTCFYMLDLFVKA